jgi:plastocyanin
MTWAALARGSAAASAAIAIGRGTTLGDRESIAIGVALALVVVLTFRSDGVLPKLGWIGIGALLVNQAAWMLPATWSLKTSAPSVAGAAAPIVLSVAAVLGLVASMARWRGASNARAGTAIVGAGAVVIALFVTVPIAGGNAVDVQAGDLRLVTRDVAFKPTRLNARAGDVGVVVKNDDLFWHTFTVNRLNANVRVATGGRRRIVLRNLRAGRYEFVCAIPGHESAGMTGVLVVS